MTDLQEKEYYQQLGQKFKALRKKVGKTAEDVADEIGVDRALIAQFENNGKKISAYRINQLLEVFGFQTIDETIEEPLSDVKKLNYPIFYVRQHPARQTSASANKKPNSINLACALADNLSNTVDHLP